MDKKKWERFLPNIEYKILSVFLVFLRIFLFLSVNICLTKNKDKKAQPFGRMKVNKIQTKS